jgi:hypothetical protein
MAAMMVAALFVLVNSASAAPHDELRYMPKDTTFVIQFDLASIQKTKLFKEVILSHPMFSKVLGEAKRELGIDPLKAIKTISMGFGKQAGPKDMSIVLDTVLDPSKPPLKKPHVKKMNHKGQAYYDLGKGGAATIMAGHTIIGSSARLLKSIDEVKSNGALATSLAASSKARDAKAQLWIFGKPPAAPQMGPMAGQIESMTGHVDFSAGLRAEFNVVGNANFVKMMSATLGMQKQAAAQHPMIASMGLGSMLQKVTIKDQNKTLAISINLNDQDVNKLKTIANMMMMGQAMKGGPGAMPTPPGGKAPGMTPIPTIPKPAAKPNFGRPPVAVPPPAIK